MNHLSQTAPYLDLNGHTRFIDFLVKNLAIHDLKKLGRKFYLSCFDVIHLGALRVILRPRKVLARLDASNSLSIRNFSIFLSLFPSLLNKDILLSFPLRSR